MHAVVRQIQQSQSDMQVHSKTLSAAVTSLYEFTENPSCDTSFQHTATMLEEAVATAEVEQHALLDNAVSIATKMNSLYQNRPLGPQAQLCMELHSQFMDIISPFIWPFDFTKEQLLEQMNDHDHKMKFDTRPKSMYMHLLAFHMKDIQLELLW